MLAIAAADAAPYNAIPAAITTAARHRDAFMRLRYSGSQCADRLAKSIGSPTTLRGVRNQNVKAVS